MSTWERSLTWLEAAADWANPILVKETRQSLKSRQFVVTFMLMLAVSWFLFVMGVAGGGSALEYGAIGSQFFFFFHLILSTAVLIVVPFGAHRSLLAERDQATYDLLSITTLSPRQIVWGKLLSSLVQVLIFYSAIAPFIAFTSLLQGFDFVFVASMLVMTLLLSMFVTMAAIASSAMLQSRQWQAFASIGALAGIVWLSSATLMGLYGFLRSFDPSDTDQWAGLIFTVIIAASYFVLFLKIATAQLTFESDDRSSGIRIVCSVQFFLVWVGLIVFAWIVGGSAIDEEFVIIATVLSAIHLAIVGLFASTEDSFLSRRIRRNLPENGFRRLLHVPFLQGGSRGYLYMLIHIGLFTLVSFWATLVFVGTHHDWSFTVPLAMSAYLTIYLGIGCALGRWLSGLSSDIRPGHKRVLLVILFAIGCIAPYIPLLWINSIRYSYSPIQVSDPFSTLIHIGDDGSYTPVVLPILGVATIVMVLVNLRAIKQGIAEVVFAEIKPRTPEPPPTPVDELGS